MKPGPWNSNFPSLFVLVAVALSASLVSASPPPEKVLCAYYYPDEQPTPDTFKTECKLWCAQVLDGKADYLPKPPNGSSCDTIEVPRYAGRSVWENIIKKCKEGGYKACAYNGHSTGYTFGREATDVGLSCFAAHSCKGFISNSCFGIDDRMVATQTKRIKSEISDGTILCPEEGKVKFQKFHQVFSATRHDPHSVSMENAVTLFLYRNKESCDVAALYQPCSVPFPKQTNQACFAVAQSYTCQNPSSSGRPIQRPEDLPQQVLGKEVCCYDPISGSLQYQQCEKTKTPSIEGEFNCRCLPPRCNRFIGQKCTGYRGFESRRPGLETKCTEKMGATISEETLCCKNPVTSQEADYGAASGIWAKKGACGERKPSGESDSGLRRRATEPNGDRTLTHY